MKHPRDESPVVCMPREMNALWDECPWEEYPWINAPRMKPPDMKDPLMSSHPNPLFPEMLSIL